MPERKAIGSSESIGSSPLSSLDDLLEDPQETSLAAPEQQTHRPEKKRRVVASKGRAIPSSKSSRNAAKNAAVSDPTPANGLDPHPVSSAKARRGKKGLSVEESKSESHEVEAINEASPKPLKRKRKTPAEKDAEAMPLAIRTTGHKLFLGAHVSSAGGQWALHLMPPANADYIMTGVPNAVLNSIHIGANAFALFLKSQRKWANPALTEDVCALFHSNCKLHKYGQMSHVVPHGSYLVNLAHTDQERTRQAYDAFLDDLKRCERLGIKLYNFHPGVANSTGGDKQAAIQHLAANLNRAHKETNTVVTLLENMAAGGNVLGSTFEDLRDTIALVQDKSRVGVCLDTCHAFAGGYDLRTPEAFKNTMEHFEEVVGIQYLRAVHMNDSKAPFASHRDLHANIGTGFLGLRSFHNIINDPRFEGLPLILETPIEAKDENGVPLKNEKGKGIEDKGIWAREIKLLESLLGMDINSEKFAMLEKDLARKGEPERQRLSEQIQRKREKQGKKKESSKKKGGAKRETSTDEE